MVSRLQTCNADPLMFQQQSSQQLPRRRQKSAATMAVTSSETGNHVTCDSLSTTTPRTRYAYARWTRSYLDVAGNATNRTCTTRSDQWDRCRGLSGLDNRVVRRARGLGLNRKLIICQYMRAVHFTDVLSEDILSFNAREPQNDVYIAFFFGQILDVMETGPGINIWPMTHDLWPGDFDSVTGCPTQTLNVLFARIPGYTTGPLLTFTSKGPFTLRTSTDVDVR